MPREVGHEKPHLAASRRETLAAGVARYYEIEATGAGPVFDLTLSYLETELNGEAEASLALWRLMGAVCEGPKAAIARDTAANWLTVGGQTGFSDWVIAEDLSLVGVGDGTPARPAFALAPNWPNPFNPSTRLEYSLPAAGRVRLTVHDVAERLVRALVDAELPAGAHAAAWDGTDDRGRAAPSGTYFARLEAAGRVATGRMGLLR